jgi:hypothetical protein
MNVFLIRMAKKAAVVFVALATARSFAQSPAGNITLNDVARVRIADNVYAYQVDYTYTVPGKKSVRIADVGTVPAKGHFHYLTRSENIEIDDLDTGTMIVSKPLHETVVVAAKPPLTEIPSANLFEKAYKTYEWNSDRSLGQYLDDLLNKHFHYLPVTVDGNSTITTSFAPVDLPNAPNGTLARVALMITFPHDISGKDYRFYVSTYLLEGRSHSDDFRPTSDPNIVAACDHFLADIFALPAAKKGDK